MVYCMLQLCMFTLIRTYVYIHMALEVKFVICSISIQMSLLDQWLQFRFIHLSFDLLLDILLHEVNERGENG